MSIDFFHQARGDSFWGGVDKGFAGKGFCEGASGLQQAEHRAPPKNQRQGRNPVWPQVQSLGLKSKARPRDRSVGRRKDGRLPRQRTGLRSEFPGPFSSLGCRKGDPGSLRTAPVPWPGPHLTCRLTGHFHTCPKARASVTHYIAKHMLHEGQSSGVGGGGQGKGLTVNMCTNLCT